MSSHAAYNAARLRGLATGALTATLAVAAHAVAGGHLPSGAAIAELAVLATTIGVIAFTASAGTCALLALLCAGQLIGHLLLGAAEHAHSAQSGAPAVAMLAAHVAAVAIGALLIASGEKLCSAVSRAVRGTRSPMGQLVRLAPAVAIRSADQPMRSELLLATSVSHRGPPVSSTF